MQFPNPWLSDILKPLSNAIFLSPNDKSVLLLTLLASSCICWSSWMIRSKEPRKEEVLINLTAWKKRNNSLLKKNNPQSGKRNFEVKRKRRAPNTRLPLFFSNMLALKWKLQLLFEGVKITTCLISEKHDQKYFSKFTRSIVGPKSKVKERKLLDILAICLYFFRDVNYRVSLIFYYSLEVSNKSTVSCSVDMSIASTCWVLELVHRLLEAKKI